ncbi:VOC family protein [Actinomadura sp. KC06]|uniref:VOC family protein n=1 Tax=Actinomadura sp. KC06 TaxID=2530369 RepID=UPI001050AF5B|nr:VOC family protein [Actinomadura sp. KC06]TDD28390.1 VOC family protein [Actinomadura sp. KC06]
MADEKLTTCLWFDGQAEEAANHYVSIFKNSALGEVTRSGEGGPGEPGSVMTVEWEVNGQKFVGLNGGPEFTFNEAVSFMVHCDDQAEVDYYWNRLVEGGQEAPCGWLKDRFGLSWQIVPKVLYELMSDPDPEKAGRATQAMLATHGKLDIAALKKAHAGG